MEIGAAPGPVFTALETLTEAGGSVDLAHTLKRELQLEGARRETDFPDTPLNSERAGMRRSS